MRKISKNDFSSIITAAALIAAVLACSSGDSKSVPPEFRGSWLGEDASTIFIRDDSSADYRHGSTHVTGGTASLSDDGKRLSIKLAVFGPTFNIDKAPTGNEMTLDGVVYRKIAVRAGTQ